MDGTGIAEKAGFVVTGGGARSEMLRQILADVMGATIRSSTEHELGLLGAHAAGALDAFDGQLGAGSLAVDSVVITIPMLSTRRAMAPSPDT